MCEGEETQVERLLYRLYGIYLLVLPDCSAVEMVAVIGGDAASTVFGPPQGQDPCALGTVGNIWLLCGEGPRATAAEPAGGVAVGARLWGGPSAFGPGGSVDTGLRLVHLCKGGAGLSVPQQPGAPSHAGPLPCPAGAAAEGAGGVLREAVNLLQPLLASGSRLEGDFWWICTLLGASRGVLQHGAHKAASVCVLPRHAGGHAVAAATLLGALDAPFSDP